MFHFASSTIAQLPRSKLIVAWHHWGIGRVNRTGRAEGLAEADFVWTEFAFIVLRDTKTCMYEMRIYFTHLGSSSQPIVYEVGESSPFAQSFHAQTLNQMTPIELGHLRQSLIHPASCFTGRLEQGVWYAVVVLSGSIQGSTEQTMCLLRAHVVRGTKIGDRSKWNRISNVVI